MAMINLNLNELVGKMLVQQGIPATAIYLRSLSETPENYEIPQNYNMCGKVFADISGIIRVPDLTSVGLKEHTHEIPYKVLLERSSGDLPIPGGSDVVKRILEFLPTGMSSATDPMWRYIFQPEEISLSPFLKFGECNVNNIITHFMANSFGVGIAQAGPTVRNMIAVILRNGFSNACVMPLRRAVHEGVYMEDFKGSDEEAVVAVSMHCVRSFFTRGLGRVLLEKGLDVSLKQSLVADVTIIIDTAFDGVHGWEN